MDNKKYIAILFNVVKYDEEKGIYLFRPYDFVDNSTFEYNGNIDTDILIDSSGEKYYPMESLEVIDNNLERCYGYPIAMDSLSIFSSSDDYYNMVEDYFSKIDNTIFFGICDREEGVIKNVLVDKDDISKYHDDSWFFSIYSDIDSFEDIASFSDEARLSLNYEKINSIISCLEEGKVLKIVDFFKRANDYILNENSIEFPNLDDDIDEVIDTKDLSIEDRLTKVKPYLDKLDNLVGLSNVKKEVYNLISLLTFYDKTKDKLNMNEPNLNMFFTGNAGTGKTTVARIIKDILYNLGYTKNDKFKELTTKDLIGQYVGETAIKTDKVLNDNKGGVIFIDEAYSFTSEGQQFGDEALVEIIKEMEKKETVFIFAGYRDEMNNFINKNPGLASRIGYYIDYKDYNEEELLQILKNKIKDSNMNIDPSLDNKILEVIKRAKGNNNFGNGRFIDKLYEKIILSHATNTKDISDSKELFTISSKDINESLDEELIFKNNNKRPIGFTYQKKK